MSYFTTPLESATRKRLDALLENLGWDCDEQSAREHLKVCDTDSGKLNR